MKTALSGLFAVISVLLASSCCIFPAFLALLPAGLGFKLAQFRWYLIGLGIIGLAFGYYNEFFRECGCSGKRMILNRTILIISTIVLLILVAYQIYIEVII